MRNREIQKYTFYMQNYEEVKSCYKYCEEVLRRPYITRGVFTGEYDSFVKAVDHVHRNKYQLIISDLNALRHKANWLHYLKNAKIKFYSPTLDVEKNSLHFLINYAELFSDRLSYKTVVPLRKAKEDIKEKGSYVTKQGKVITKLGSPDIVSAQKKAATVHSLKARAWLGNKGNAIQNLRSAGWTFQKIADHLNDLEVPTRQNSTWTKSKIFKVLRGRAKHND